MKMGRGVLLTLISLMVLLVIPVVDVNAVDENLPPAVQAVVTPPEAFGFTPELGSKIVLNCAFAKDYLAENLRINDIATKRNRIRSYEDSFRRLDSLVSSYKLYKRDTTDLLANIASFRAQKDLFSDDFENYYKQLQLVSQADCNAAPEVFWKELETLKEVRAALALSVTKLDRSILALIDKEITAW